MNHAADDETSKPDGEIWHSELRLAAKYFEDWEKRGKKIIARYRDEQHRQVTTEDDTRPATFNMLWANVTTLEPIVYGQPPKVKAERRFKDSDPIGRVASLTLERATQYCVDSYDLHSTFCQVRKDYLLVGRGVVWMRYLPLIKRTIPAMPPAPAGVAPGAQNGPAAQVLPGPSETVGAAPAAPEASPARQTPPLQPSSVPTEKLEYEEVRAEYVDWRDFLHSPARTWEEVRWVARKVHMTKSGFEARWKGKSQGLPMDYSPVGIDDKSDPKEQERFKRYTIWEIWDKETRKVMWIAVGGKEFLEVRDDFLGLRDFFPCPKPAFAYLTNDTLIPIPEFKQYQCLADELDDITARIALLVEALRVAGVYDASFEGLAGLVDPAAENKLIPITNWPQLAQNGGLAGVIQWMPIEQVVKALLELYNARDKTVQQLYELTGMADIIRGSTDASETATAQQMKSQYANLRMRERIREIARFCRDVIRLKAEIIAEHFEPETIALMSGIGQMSQTAQRAFDKVIQLLKSDSARTFRIDIETDSTVALDEDAEKQRRIEFLNSATGFVKAMAEVGTVAPNFTVAFGEIIKFCLQAFPAGRELEEPLDKAIQSTAEEFKQAQSQDQPDPEAEKRAQEMEFAQQKADLEMRVKQLESDLRQQEIRLRTELTKVETAARIRLAEEQHKHSIYSDAARNGHVMTAHGPVNPALAPRRRRYVFGQLPDGRRTVDAVETFDAAPEAVA